MSPEHFSEASQRQILTILAADIVASTEHISQADPDDAQEFLDTCFTHLRRAIEQAGGVLISFEGDGGIAAFGWPNPVEDHAFKACCAAWNIQKFNDGQLAPDGRPVAYRVGVHSGLVAVREIRQRGRSRFNAVGATVNIAAKLQQACPPGGVLISAETTKLSRQSFETEPYGSNNYVEAFRLVGEPAVEPATTLGERYRSPMVGRTSELAELLGLLQAAGSAAVLGEPGIGKSRLAAAVFAQFEREGRPCLACFGDGQRRSTPFFVARELLRTAMASADTLLEPLTEQQQRSLFQGSINGAEGRRRSVPTQNREQAVSAFADALQASRHALLLVEDLHLIDEESRQVLKRLASNAAAAPSAPRLLVTGRPEATETARDITASQITLGPLPPETMAELSRQLAPTQALSAPLLDRLLSRAGGVPFILEELVRALDGQPAPRLVLPQTVASLVHSRLHRLSAGARSVLQILSLLGEQSDFALVEAMLGRRRATFERDLAELEAFAFVHPPAGRRAQVRHQIIAEACVDTLPKQRRQQLHRTAYNVLRSRNADLSGRYGQLAHHAEGGGDLTSALDCLWNAGQEARRAAAASSLNLIFDRAMAVIEAIGDRAEGRYTDFVLMAFTQIAQLGEFEKVAPHLERVVTLVRRRGDPGEISGALSQLAMICWFEGRYDEGLSAAEEGLAIARTLKSPSLMFANHFMLNNLLHDRGDVARAIAENHDLLATLSGELENARLGAAAHPRATALSFMSYFLMDTGRYQEGLDYVMEGLSIARREGDAYAEALARNGLARNLILLGRYEEAAECAEIGWGIAERNGYDAIMTDFAGRMAQALARCGEAEKGVAIADECIRRGLHQRTGRPEIFNLLTGHGEALVRACRPGPGLERLDLAIDGVRRIGNPRLTIAGLDIRAALLAGLDPGDERIEADIRERDRLCLRFGLTAPPASPALAQA